jgi:hypothetical protein
MLSVTDRHVIARESNVVRVDFSREPDPPAPCFPGANGLRLSDSECDGTAPPANVYRAAAGHAWRAPDLSPRRAKKSRPFGRSPSFSGTQIRLPDKNWRHAKGLRRSEGPAARPGGRAGHDRRPGPDGAQGEAPRRRRTSYGAKPARKKGKAAEFLGASV